MSLIIELEGYAPLSRRYYHSKSKIKIDDVSKFVADLVEANGGKFGLFSKIPKFEDRYSHISPELLQNLLNKNVIASGKFESFKATTEDTSTLSSLLYASNFIGTLELAKFQRELERWRKVYEKICDPYFVFKFEDN